MQILLEGKTIWNVNVGQINSSDRKIRQNGQNCQITSELLHLMIYQMIGAQRVSNAFIVVKNTLHQHSIVPARRTAPRFSSRRRGVAVPGGWDA